MATKKEEKTTDKTEEKPQYRHVNELFLMTFVTDKPGEYVGLRHGIQAGTIEFYPKKVG